MHTLCIYLLLQAGVQSMDKGWREEKASGLRLGAGGHTGQGC